MTAGDAAPATWTTLPDRRLLHVEPAQIIFEARAREKYEDLDELAESIREKGIIQPLAVQATSNPEQFRLLAGGRRYSAAVLARLRPLPVVVFPAELDDLDRKEIELFENIHRKDLTWVEQDKLNKEIHSLMVSRFGMAVGGGVQTGHSHAATARLLGKERSTVTKSLRRAEALEEHPELEQARNAAEADRILKSIERKQSAAKAAAAFESESGVLSDEGAAKRALVGSYMVGDFFEMVRQIPDRSIDLVEIDPPYSIDLPGIKKAEAHTTLGYLEAKDEEYVSFMAATIQETCRVLRADGWMLLWFGFQWYTEMAAIIGEILDMAVVPAFWVKSIQGQSLRPETRLGSTVEGFLYARKGNAVLQKQGRSNCFLYAPVESSRKIHPTERPVEMMQEVLSTFAAPNAHVLTPFAGSGNTLLAASNCKMHCIGFDLDQGGSYRNGFVQRVQEGRVGQFRSYQAS